MKSRKRDSAKNVDEKSVEQQEANEKVLKLREEVNNVAERRQDFDAGINIFARTCAPHATLCSSMQ